MAKINSLAVLDMVYQALSSYGDPRLNDVSFDCDNHDGELIITMDDGNERTDWIIRSSLIHQVDRPLTEGT